MKPAAFEYCRPDSLEEALAALAELGEDACVMAGGLSLAAMLNMRIVRPKAVIDINRIPGLDVIEAANGSARTGALVRQADALKSKPLLEAAPLLGQALPHVGHYQTRGRGTLCGSVAHADPSAEIPLCLVTLGGEVELTSRSGARRLPADAFFEGIMTTARAPDEMVTGLLWPRHDRSRGVAFAEIAQRQGDFAIASVAVVAGVGADGSVSALRFGLGGVEDRPRALDCAPFLGAPATADTAREIAENAARSLDPASDRQATADYRRQLVRVLGARAIGEAFEQAGGKG